MTASPARRRRLLFIAPSAYPLGGVQEWLSTLIPDLQALGHRVQLAIPDGALHDAAAYRRTHPGIPCLSFANPSGSAMGRRRCLMRLLLAHPADLVLGVNIGDLYPAVRALRRNAGWSTPVAMTLHALEPDYFADLAAEADVIAAVIASNRLSQGLACSLSGMAPARSLYAPYGVVRGRRGFPPAAGKRVPPLRIAWVGRLEQPQKRVHDLIPILTALDRGGLDYRLTLAGDGPERLRLEETLRPWLRRGCVTLAGTVPRQRLLDQLYPEHDALLITSSWETGPIVAWEAMAAGLPVVSSDYLGRGLEAALIPERTCLSFPCGDGDAAAAALQRLADPALHQRLSRAGAALVRSRYSRSRSCQRWCEAIEAAIALPPLPRPAAAPPAAAMGRLDRCIGPGPAETMRWLFRRRYVHTQPGSEWPHAVHAARFDEEQLLHQATRLETDA
ncbi:MAG: glycosyltransferase family 4 protein [Synechococcaceae cyanobacterium]|nr:glycosyltransferase family 4 protein [Synechococcaceae cyanobacterium]